MRTPYGDTIEVGLMGAEGFVGLSLVYGVERSNGTVVVQLAGRARRMRAPDFKRHIKERGGPLQELLLRYANFFHVTVQQHAACNAAHRIEARMCRWILLTHDRVEGDVFPLTQEYLALMLGVRRPTVSEIAHRLKEAGLINYTRGNLAVTDRGGLEAAACECYRMVREQIARTFHADEPSARTH